MYQLHTSTHSIKEVTADWISLQAANQTATTRLRGEKAFLLCRSIHTKT
uniref:Uncharacterized protein n=1 Tax=Arundo donax TaxID=35708 RepID=A0A0A9DC44_ARUDO